MVKAAKKSAPKKSAPVVEAPTVDEVVEAIEEVVEAVTEDTTEVETEAIEETIEEATEETMEKVYPEIECEVYTHDNPMTWELAKEFLGWTEPKEGEEFPDPDVIMFGKTIMLAGIREVQRSVTPGLYERYAQEILHGNWAGMREDETPNGEPIIVGWYAHVIEGMHRFLGLGRAVELWLENPDAYPFWETRGEPTLPTIMIRGISESIRVLNTINTGKPRNLADALHTSGLFKDFTKRDMKRLCKAADFAIKTVWDHVGMPHAYGPRKSHAEALDFLLRHPKLVEVVKSCFAEEPKLSETGVSCGAMAALTYLMGASKTVANKKNGQGYYQVDKPSENQIDFSRMAKAEEFMMKFAQGDPAFKTLYNAILNLTDNEDGKNFGIFRSVDRNILYEKTCLIFKTWKCWLDGNPITIKTIGLKYRTDEEGEKFLNEEVICDGIDLGINRKEQVTAEDAE